MPGCQNTWQMKFQAKYQIEYRLVGISRKNRFIRLVAQVCVSLIFVASSIEFVSDSCFQSLPALEASAWYSYTSVALICFDFPVQLARLNQQRSQAAKQLVGRICVHQCVLCRGDVGGEIFFPKSHCQCLDSGTNSDVCKTLQDSIASALVGVALRFVAFVLVEALVR